MIIRIQFESEIPIYKQLRDQIVQGIAQGDFQTGDTLPSVRRMGQELGINLHTVNKAYTLLRQQGFTVIHKRKGVLINSPEKIREHLNKNHLTEDLRPILSEMICRGMSQKDILDFFKKNIQQIQGDYHGACKIFTW